MATNDFLLFGAGGGANVVDQATYSALAARTAGFVAGTALSAQLNKAWRQGSVGTALLGQYIADHSLQNAVDDGNLATLLGNFIRALRKQDINYYIAGGTANALTVTSAAGETILALSAGLPIRIRGTLINTGAPTLACDGLAAKNIVYPDGVNLLAGEITTNSVLEVIYNATTDKFVMVSPTLVYSKFKAFKPSKIIYATPGTTSHVATVTGPHRFTIWGGGGGGGHGSGTGASAGGSAGAYIEITEHMNVGDSASITVGAAGAAGTLGVGATAGGASQVVVNGNTYNAGGGPPGSNATTGTTNSPATATVPTAGDIKLIGGQGWPGIQPNSPSVFSGKGGDAYRGGVGGIGGGGGAGSGTAPGAGGGGSGSGSAAGAGARGEVWVEY